LIKPGAIGKHIYSIYKIRSDPTTQILIKLGAIRKHIRGISHITDVPDPDCLIEIRVGKHFFGGLYILRVPVRKIDHVDIRPGMQKH
jgi:hypothetical protein